MSPTITADGQCNFVKAIGKGPSVMEEGMVPMVGTDTFSSASTWTSMKRQTFTYATMLVSFSFLRFHHRMFGIFLHCKKIIAAPAVH